MKQVSSVNRLILGISYALLLCFGLQALVIYGLGWKAGKGESNYFSTLSRFQAAAGSPAKIALTGSSITGRLPGREIGNMDIANLGSDGGPALDGIRMLVTGHIPLPQWLVVETNTLYGGVGYEQSLMARNAESPWFMIGARMPLLGASARPTSILYNALLRRPKILCGEPFEMDAPVSTTAEETTSIQLTAGENERLDAYLEGLRLLHASGVKILLIRYPAGDIAERDVLLEEKTIATLSKTVKLHYVNMQNSIPRSQLEFTDAVHLERKSAARLLETLRWYCKSLERM